jgi:hypothetical protein
MFPATNTVPDSMRLSPTQQVHLEAIRTVARARHDKRRKTALKAGRSFPELPFECSWAFEEQFRRDQA